MMWDWMARASGCPGGSRALASERPFCLASASIPPPPPPPPGAVKFKKKKAGVMINGVLLSGSWRSGVASRGGGGDGDAS